jgi:hypothetical protein
MRSKLLRLCDKIYALLPASASTEITTSEICIAPPSHLTPHQCLPHSAARSIRLLREDQS